MTDTTALLPCPFCGGEAKRFTLEEPGDNYGGDVIVCLGRCGASSHVEFGRKENLVSLWNTRTLATPSASVPEQPTTELPENMRELPSATPDPEKGQVVWCSSEEDGGPDVGILLGLGGGKTLWLGELLNAEGGGTGFIVYGPGKQATAPLSDWEEVREIIEQHVAPALWPVRSGMREAGDDRIAVAKALARHPDSSWDDYEWEDMAGFVRDWFLEQAGLAIAALSTSLDTPKGEGMVLVPREPTEAMVEAAISYRPLPIEARIRTVWADMIAAASTPGEPADGEVQS